MEYDKITEKMKKFKKHEGLNELDLRKRYAVRCEIHKSLQDYYPDCQVFIYGSTINGYGTKMSDLDLLFLPFPEYDSENNDNCEKEEIAECPLVNDIKTGQIPKENLLKMNKNLQLLFVRKVLQKSKQYQKLMYIQCRCPIINFYIPKLKVTGDISCGSKQVVYNTKLFQLFNKIDDRVTFLTMYLRHWAKSLAVIQSGILSSYAFTLLVIYFLQNTSPPILPNVKHLIEQSNLPLIVDGWKVAVLEEGSKIKKSANTSCCGELLAEFFCFYRKFDFSRVISVYYGESLGVEDFFKTNDERVKDFKVSPLSIQDPFILSFNVSRNIKAPVLSSFKKKLYIAKNIIQEKNNSSVNNEIFFDEKIYKERMNAFSPPIPDKASFCCIGLDLIYGNASHNQKETFYQKICQDLLDLLQYGLLIDSEVIDKKRFVDNGSSKQENFELLMSVQCAVFNRTYVGRSKVTEPPSLDSDSAQFNDTTLREEFIISKSLIQSNPLLTCPQPFFWFLCDCYKSNLDEIEDIVITFIPLTEYKQYKPFFSFLKSFLPKKLSKMILDNKSLDSLSIEV